AVVPLIEPLEFDVEDGGLKGIHAEVSANEFVVVAGGFAVLTGLEEAGGEFFVASDQCAGVACSAEVFGGVEGEAGTACVFGELFAVRIASADGLGGVFNDIEFVLAGDGG